MNVSYFDCVAICDVSARFSEICGVVVWIIVDVGRYDMTNESWKCVASDDLSVSAKCFHFDERNNLVADFESHLFHCLRIVPVFVASAELTFGRLIASLDPRHSVWRARAGELVHLSSVRPSGLAQADVRRNGAADAWVDSIRLHHSANLCADVSRLALGFRVGILELRDFDEWH